MTIIYPAIVVATYNRPYALQRLLNSIAKADYKGYKNIPLVISVDGGGNPQCTRIAEEFEWQYGEKRVITHSENIGLKAHILSCGDLTEQYGAIIMLEEDVYVSPYFYDYSVQTTSYYQSENKIAGVSLYLYRFHEYANIAFFMPIPNGKDVFFMQVPSSWGQCWTQKQWYSFRKWFFKNGDKDIVDSLPASVRQWSKKTSWKLFFYAYMVECDMFFVYPYISYSVCMGDEGEHIETKLNVMQNSLSLFPRKYILSPFSKNGVVYDAYMELFPHFFWQMGFHSNEDFCVNIYGNKTDIKQNCMLSLLPCKSPIEEYGLDFIPIENNIIFRNEGVGLAFGRTVDFMEQSIRIKDERLAYMFHSRMLAFAKNVGRMEREQELKRTIKYRLGDAIVSPIGTMWNRVKGLFK